MSSAPRKRATTVEDLRKSCLSYHCLLSRSLIHKQGVMFGGNHFVAEAATKCTCMLGKPITEQYVTSYREGALKQSRMGWRTRGLLRHSTSSG